MAWLDEEKGGRIRPGSIDVHAHATDPVALAEMARLAPDLVPSLSERDGVWYTTFPGGPTRSIETGLLDISVRLADMDRQGVQYQALACWVWLYLYEVPADRGAELLQMQNDSLIDLARRFPDRFVALPGLPLQDAARSIREIERLAKIPEVAGVQIGTNVNNRNLDDPSLDPVWAALEAHDIPVLFHPDGVPLPGSFSTSERLSRYHLKNLIGNPLDTAIALASLAFGGVMKRYPGLRFCFVHGGGFMPYQLGRWDHGWDVRREAKVNIDCHPSEYIERCWFDHITHDKRALEFLGKRFGWSQIVLGTDHPWDMETKTPLEDLEAVGLDDATFEQVASVNPKAFLRWPSRSET